MGVSSKPVVNFAGGEASHKLRGRVDVVPYFTCAEQLENVLCTHYGSAVRTPGTAYVARAKKQAEYAVLIPFIFSTGESYVLEFGEQYMRVFQAGGSVVENGKNIDDISKASPCVVTTTEAHGYVNGDYIDIEAVVGMEELNERRFIVADATSSTFALKDEDGNYVNSSDYTAYESDGTTERVYQITTPWHDTEASSLRFTQQADVMYICHPLYLPYKLSRYGNTNWTLATITYDTFDWPPFMDINVTATTLTPSATTGTITLSASTSFFTSDHVGAYFKLDHSGTIGYVKVTAVASGTSATCTVISTLGAATATEDWYEGSWSEKNGYPSDVKFYENRLYYFATNAQPLTVWGSTIEEYDNFNVGTGESGAITDEDAISYQVSSAQVDRILWAYPTQVLNLGTGGGPFTLQSGSTLEPISSSNVSVKQQNEDGAANIPPVRIGSYIYYVTRSKKQLGQLTYNLDTDSYLTDNITYLSDHILGDGVVGMTLQRYPYNILWCWLEDGTIATLSREQTNNVKSWTRQIITNGFVEWMTCIPAGTEDQVWMLVKRTIDGNTRRYIEIVMPHEFDGIEEAFFVQSGMRSLEVPLVITNIEKV
jgi:hypothetical protein